MFRVELLETIGANSVAELYPGMVCQVLFDLDPESPVITDLLAA
jgi:hypothetical protein